MEPENIIILMHFRVSLHYDLQDLSRIPQNTESQKLLSGIWFVVSKSASCAWGRLKSNPEITVLASCEYIDRLVSSHNAVLTFPGWQSWDEYNAFMRTDQGRSTWVYLSEMKHTGPHGCYRAGDAVNRQDARDSGTHVLGAHIKHPFTVFSQTWPLTRHTRIRLTYFEHGRIPEEERVASSRFDSDISNGHTSSTSATTEISQCEGSDDRTLHTRGWCPFPVLQPGKITWDDVNEMVQQSSTIHLSGDMTDPECELKPVRCSVLVEMTCWSSEEEQHRHDRRSKAEAASDDTAEFPEPQQKSPCGTVAALGTMMYDVDFTMISEAVTAQIRAEVSPAPKLPVGRIQPPLDVEKPAFVEVLESSSEFDESSCSED